MQLQNEAHAANQYQKKMMMKNTNQLRNSYNSVGPGHSQNDVGAMENVRNS